MLPRSVSPLPLGSDLPPLRMFGRPRRSDSPAPSLSSSSSSTSSLGSCLDGVQPTSSSSSYVDHDGYTITTSVEGEGTIAPHRGGHLPASAPEHQQAEHQRQQQLPTAFHPLQPMNAQSHQFASSFSPPLPHEARGAAGPGSYPPSASLSALAHSKLMDPFSSGIVGFPMTASASTTSSASAHPPPLAPSSASMARFSSLIDGLDTVQPTTTTTSTPSNGGGHYDRSMTTTTTPSHLPFPLSRDLHPPSSSPFSPFHALPPPPAYGGQPTPTSSSSASAFQPLPDYGPSFMPPRHHPRTYSPSPSPLPPLHPPQPPHFPASRGTAASPPPPYAVGPSSNPQYYGHNLHQRPTSTSTSMTAAAGSLPARAGGGGGGHHPSAGSFAPPTPTSASTIPAGHASSSSLHFASSGASPSSLPSPSTTSSCQPSASPRGEPSCPEFQLNLPTHQADAELVEEVYIFGQNYKAHCRELYRATREGLFALAQENVARFWPMVGRFQRLLSLHAVIEQVVRFDKLFYEALVEAAVAGIDNRRIDSARAVLGFAQSLPSWTFHAASRSLPPSLFHPKMTLLKRSAREMMLRAQICYFGGLLAAVFNEAVLGRPVAQVLADPHLHLAAAQIALAADGGAHAKRPRTANNSDSSYYDQHYLSSGGSGGGEESSNDAWSVKSNNTNNSQHGVKQESEGAAGFGNPLKRSRDGSDGNGWADKSKTSENETALVTQKMFEDWRNLNTQDLVTDMMHQHGATSLWGVVTFSPVLVARLIADQLERKSRIEHWFASFVEAYLIKDLLLDHRDTNSAWYAAVPFTNKDGMANAFSDPTIDASSVSGGSRNTVKLLSDSHVFCMQWRCFSSQVLRRLESNRASTVAMFAILFAWIDALLDFFLDKRRAQFLSLSTTKRSTAAAAGAPNEVASSPSLAGSSDGRSDTPVHFPASSPAPERSGAHHATAAAEHHRRQQQQQQQYHQQYSHQYHQQPGGGGAGGGSAAMPTPDLRQHVPLRPFPNQQHYYHELLQQHHQQQMHAMMTAQAQHRASSSPSTATATTPVESPSQAPSAASQRVPSSPGSAGYRTPLSPRQPPAKRQRSPTTPTTSAAATPPTLMSHLFQFKQKPTPSPTSTSANNGSGPSQPSQASPRLGMSPPSLSSPSLPTVPSKLRSPSEVMSQLGLPQSLLARMQRNVATSTPPASSTSSSASGSESSATNDSARKSAGAQVSYSSESSPTVPSSPPSSPASPGASSSSSTSSFTAPRYVVQR